MIDTSALRAAMKAHKAACDQIQHAHEAINRMQRESQDAFAAFDEANAVFADVEGREALGMASAEELAEAMAKRDAAHAAQIRLESKLANAERLLPSLEAARLAARFSLETQRGLLVLPMAERAIPRVRAELRRGLAAYAQWSHLQRYANGGVSGRNADWGEGDEPGSIPAMMRELGLRCVEGPPGLRVWNEYPRMSDEDVLAFCEAGEVE